MDKFKIFVIVAIVVLAAAIGAGIFLIMGMQQNQPQPGEPQEYTIPADELEMLYLEDVITANLALTEDQIPHIARLSLAFRIHNKSDDYDTFMADFLNNNIILKNHIISMLRNMTYDELNQVGAQEMLAQMFKEEINALFDTNIIQEVYFGELFIQ